MSLTTREQRSVAADYRSGMGFSAEMQWCRDLVAMVLGLEEPLEREQPPPIAPAEPLVALGGARVALWRYQPVGLAIDIVARAESRTRLYRMAHQLYD